MPDPLALARSLWDAFRTESWAEVRSRLHPDARIVSALLPEITLGRDLALYLWQVAITSGTYEPRPYAYIQLADDEVLVIGLFRPARALRELDAIVLTFREGLLWRSQYHATIDEFRAHVSSAAASG